MIANEGKQARKMGCDLHTVDALQAALKSICLDKIGRWSLCHGPASQVALIQMRLKDTP